MDGMTQRMTKGMVGEEMDQESASMAMPEMVEAPDMDADDGGWRTDSIDVRKTENGGFIVRCSKSRESTGQKDLGSTYQSKDYAFRDLGEVAQFMADEFQGAPPASIGGGATPAPPRG